MDPIKVLELSKSLITSKRFDAAEELLFMLLKKEKTNHEIYWLLGNVFLQKDNLQSAEQMFNTARNFAPDVEEYQDNLAMFSDSHKDTEDQPAPETTPDRPERKFDFLVASIARGASRFISTCLTMHPEVYVPHRGDLDTAMAKDELPEFLASHQDIFNTINPHRVGLVQHDDTAADADKALPDQLSEIVNNDMFIMSVRNPFVAARSVYNHKLFAETTNYGFRDLGIPFMDGAQNITEVIQSNWSPEEPSQTILPPELGLDFFKTINLNNFLINKAEQNYLRCFGACETIDGHQLIVNRESELKILFDLIGVDNQFAHPFFNIQLSDPFQATMQYNPFTLDVFGQEVTFRLTYSGFSETLAEFDELTEIAVIKPDQRFKDLGLPDLDICLAAYTQHWLNLPRTVQQKIIDEMLLVPALNDVIFPRWADAYTQFMKLFENVRWLDEPPAGIIEYLKDNIADDALAFLNNHPRHEKLWTGIHDIIGE